MQLSIEELDWNSETLSWWADEKPLQNIPHTSTCTGKASAHGAIALHLHNGSTAAMNNSPDLKEERTPTDKTW